MKALKSYLKSNMSYVKTAVIAVLFTLVAIPFVNRVSGDGNKYTVDSRYMVVLNGNELGYVSDSQVAENALLDARNLLDSESEGLVLVEADMQLNEQTSGGAVYSKEQMTEKIYNSLSTEASVPSEQVTAYTVRIDDFTVTLASLDDVVELLERVKNRYADTSNFPIVINEEDNGIYSSYKINFVSADKQLNEAAKVLLAEDGSVSESAAEKAESTSYKDGVLSIGFVENIEVIATKSNSGDVVSVDEAYELVTKEHAEKETYVVASGDCLSSIARDNGLSLDELIALNEGFTVDTAIYEGDVLTITVPASEVSVKVVEEKSYSESYNAPVQYVDNDTLYVGTENVIQQGSEGSRSVVALVTYVNGTESSREIIKQEISTESVPKIIERGTLTPPTYINPVHSTYVTSHWGYRPAPINGMHNGVDIAVPVGTSVRASSTGVVTMAGWYGNYGYCVDIRHSDGSMTRYGHLNSIAVTYGQTVTQGQVIAYSGNTGYSTGPHLHFEIRINGQSVNPLNYIF